MEKKFPIFKTLPLLVWLVLGMGTAFAANCAANYVAPENAVWDGTSTQEPCTKDGYYIIDNAKKLAWYGANYNSGNAKLTADLDLGGHLWIPMAAGKGDKYYGKIFDGQNHIIKNLYVNGDELSAINKEYAQNLGFVGVLGDGKVLNLILENVDIQATTNAGTIISNQDNQISVGAVVGWMSDKGTNVVDNCMTSGTIKTTGNSQGVGGIVGNAKKGTISNCMSLVEIRTSGSKAYIGGIIGITKTEVTVSSCIYAGPGLINTGTNGAVGGIAGNVWSGSISTENDFYEGTNYYQGEEIGGVGKTCKDCNVTDHTVQVDDINSDEVICALNGMNADSTTCKTEPWSFGETGLSLNGYGIDGYKIVFNANGGAFANGKANKDKFLDAGMALTADEVGVPSRDNYKFIGWALTSDAAAPAADLGTVSHTDTIFAVWAPVYTVTFNVAPGVFPDENVNMKSKRVASGETITVEGLGTLPTKRCKVYVEGNENECQTWSYFTGWALTEGALEKDSVSLDSVAASDELVLYAVWTDVETYTVTYNANQHGRTAVDYVRVGAGDTVTAPKDPIADVGYEFDGWFTDAEGENHYQFAAQIHESIILYAKWALDTFTVTYEMNGVSNAGENPAFYTIETPTFALAAPAGSEGYVFEGWFYDANFTNPASQVIQGTTGDKTFYAKWTKKTYRVMYLADNNSYGSISDQFVEHGSSITLESAGIFRRAGYEQTGWSTTMGGAKTNELGESVTVVAPVTLYPVWSLVTYTITYMCGDGCVNNPQNPITYTYNDQFGIKSTGVTREGYEGYKFGGWYNDTKCKDNTICKNPVTQITQGSYGDTVLYGKWNRIYRINYVGTENPYNKTEYTIDDSFSLGNPASRNDGYTFVGWYDNDIFEGDSITKISKGSKGDKTLYARWAQVTKYGAVTIYVYEDKPNVTEAVIDGNYGDKAKPNVQRDAVAIPGDIRVNSVVMKRSFTVGKYSTIVLPFDVNTQNVEGLRAVLYYNGIKTENNKRSIRMKVLWAEDGCIKGENGEFVHYDYTNMRANTPYMLLMKNETFAIKSGAYPITLKETTAAEENANNSGWTFRGTWQYKEWGASGSDQETGYAYGFAASQSKENNIDVGDFVKVGAGAWIRPMRAYLVNTSRMQQMARANGAYVKRPSVVQEELPEIMSIVIDNGSDNDEQTTVIGHFNTRTGEIKMIPQNRTFDVKGRNVGNKANKARGAYYGKKSLK